MELSKKTLGIIIAVIIVIAIVVAAVVFILPNNYVNNVDESIITGDSSNLLKSLAYNTFESTAEKTGFSLDGVYNTKDIKSFEGYTIESKLYLGNNVILNNTIKVSSSDSSNDAITLIYGDFDNSKKPDKVVVKVFNTNGTVVQTIEKKL